MNIETAPCRTTHYACDCVLKRMRKLEAVAEAAKGALSLLRCEKEFPDDLCIQVGNVVRYQRVVSKLEGALAALEVPADAT
jgi:hypothetical protein